MAVLNRDDFMSAIKKVVGENPTDELVTFVENMTDTYTDLENKTKDTTDWKAKYEENDKQWKKKYVDRFFNGPADDGKKDETHSTKETLKDVENEENKNDECELKYDGLFSGAEESKCLVYHKNVL